MVFNANPYELGLGSDNSVRPHRCLGLRTYGLLKSDIDAEFELGCDALDEEAIENHCVASESSDDEEVNFICLVSSERLNDSSLSRIPILL